MEKDWITNLQVGDEVGIISRYGDKIVTVKKLTKTQIVLSNDERINRKTGSKVGRDVWDTSSFVEATEQLRQKVAHETISYEVRKLFEDKHIQAALTFEDFQNLKGILTVVKERIVK